MKTVAQVMSTLKKKGSEQTRKIYTRHGAPEDMFGCKVADMKVIAKQIKGNQDLALQLFETGNVDAMYLAGMVADGAKMNKTQLNRWAKATPWYFVSEYAVPGVVCESPHAHSLALKWIKAKKESVAACGWSTYAGILATRPDEDLDIHEIKSLLKQIEKEIDDQPGRVRYTMNGFVISAGTYVKELGKEAKATAKKIGKVEVDMGETSCKVPLATDYIAKVEKMKKVGKKRKTIKC
ncbi:MAG: DNA alkylation repair protein [Planctomycetota bacterium]